MENRLPFGLYEQVIDEQLSALLAEVASHHVVQQGHLDPGESHAVLAQHLSALIRRALDSFRGPGRISRQIGLCNEVIEALSAHSGAADESALLVGDAQRLLAIVRRPLVLAAHAPERPQTPLSASALLTGARADVSLVSQLRREIATADQVDILCSFIKWSGIRVLEEELRTFTLREGTRLRVITTSYMGATEPKAVEFLTELPHTELKVSYDSRRTRLHAKAYLFHRSTGFGTAYVGSSNLSNAALTDGLEWNVKISQYESLHLWEKLCGTFDTYWEDTEFVRYAEDQRERLRLAIQEQRSTYEAGIPFQFDIQPYPYQQQILDRLTADRVLHGRNRNLVVAATGTGKTVIAAFDFKRFQLEFTKSTGGKLPRLLFVAHREEILRQSQSCFRAVLRDPNFGDLLVGSQRPTQLDHLFVSIQSYNARRLDRELGGDHYDFVVVDEFHRAEAPSYKRLLQHVNPRVLLGLTATPERSDELDVLHHFGGHISAEIRLPEAINRKLLCPFQYFGVTDTVDLSGLTWCRGGYVAADLEARYTANDTRADLVVRTVRQKLVDPLQARGLGFCVSVAHAEYMADYFKHCGIPAEALSGGSPEDVRRTVQRRLLERQINFIFVVDLYNEGVDIPEVDTLLLLRPTESLTVFLQQFGRGLRLSEAKDCLTVLDFIGQAHRSYNWEARFRALMDRPRKRIDAEIEDGCIHLPLGCFIHLERVAQQHVLDNIRGALGGGASHLTRRIASFEEDSGRPLSLANFLEHYGWGLDEVYRRGTWSRLCARAGTRSDFSQPDERELTKGLRRIAHIDGPRLIRRLIALLSGASEPSTGFDEQALLMLHVACWKDWRPASVTESLERLSRNPVIRDELLELLRYRFERVAEVPPELELPFSCPLELHASYTRDEVLVALGCWNLERQRELREGVLRLSEIDTDAFFITLNKTETEYSPTTLYEDYAISPERFHWQSQSTTSEQSPTGKRYVEHGERGGTVLLFVREERGRADLAQPYVFLGPARYESHSGSRPMSIVWRLDHAIPARLAAGALRMSAA